MTTSIQPAQIDAMLATLADALAACAARDFDLVTRLSEQQEAELAALLPRLQQDVASLPEETRTRVSLLIAQRERLQQEIADWIGQMRDEMQTVSQNNRLLKTYTS
jgi:DNA anti-recombination protein RmuC